MSKTYKNYFLLLVLTFLQCLVPILHAHAGGVHISSHVHVHDFGLQSSAFHAVHATELRGDMSDSPVVGAACEFKRDLANDGFNGLPPGILCLNVPYSTFLVVIASPSILSYMPFRAGPPPSQAPPAFV